MLLDIITTMLSDIVEKDVNSPAKAPAPPTAPSTGFPTPQVRSKFMTSRQKVDNAAPSTSAIETAASSIGDQSIDSENRDVIAKMSPKEVSQEQADIEEKLGPKMVDFLRKRAEKSSSIVVGNFNYFESTDHLSLQFKFKIMMQRSSR